MPGLNINLTDFWMIVIIELFIISVPAIVALMWVWRNNLLLKEANEFLRDSINTPSHGLIYFKKSGELDFYNHTAKPFLEQMEKNYPGFTVTDFFNFLFDNAEECDETLKRTVHKSALDLTGKGENFREVITLDDSYYLIVVQKTNTGRTIIVIINITQRKKYEEDLSALGQSNYQLEKVIEATPVGIVVCSPTIDGNSISFVNSAFCDFIGSNKEKLDGASWAVIGAAFNESNLEELIERAFVTAAPEKVALTQGKENESRRWFEFLIDPVIDQYGRASLFIGILQDTTDLKLREEEFFKAQKLESLGQLSAGVAHDFNNILSIISGYAQLAAKKLDSAPEQCADYIKKIEFATNRGAHLTQRMLTFSRHKLNAEEILNVGDIVNDQKDMLKALLGPHIKIEVDIKDDNSNVVSSADAIAQILMNLVVNARDAIGNKNGVITLQVDKVPCSSLPSTKPHDPDECKGDYVCLSVTDNGQGMDDNTIQKLFDPFYTTKQENEGTGLGMSVVYGLVRNMNGVIDVTSKIGKGTTISMFFPLSDKRTSKNITGSEEDVSSICLEGYTALVVDDEPDLLALTSEILKDAGMTVLEASNGNEALLVQDDYDGDIDILVTDILMPEIGGIKLAEIIATVRPSTKVLFVSGYASAGKQSDDISMPAMARFLSKPLKYDEMILLVFYMLSGKKDFDLGVIPDIWRINS